MLRLYLTLLPWCVFFITRIRKLGEFPNLLALEEEKIRDCTTSQRDESEEASGPFIAETMVHLHGKKHHTSTIDGAHESLRCKRGRGLMLVGVDCEASVGAAGERRDTHTDVVVRRIVDKNESHSHWKSSN